MSSSSSVQTGLAAAASLLGRLPSGWRDMAVAGLWIAVIAAAWVTAVCWTGLAWAGFTAALAAIVVVAWQMVKTKAR